MASNALSTLPGGDAPPSAPAARAGLGSLSSLMAQPAVRKSIPLIIVTALIGAVALAWSMLATPPQKMLFSGLADADKASVTAALGQAGIDSRLDPGSGVLTVSEDDYYRARMLLASQDLPKATPGGYAILDDLPMGVSRAVEGERLRQARETELARSIQEIDSVVEARVHLAMPESSVFVRDNAAPSASVIVRLGAGRSLADSQVRSIINLVASSVPGMKADAVTIVDQTGALLTKGGSDSATALGDERIDFQRRVEEKYREQLITLLTPLVGAGNFSAEVQANVDLDETQATRESYDRAGALRNEQGSWTAGGNTPPAAAGIPGTLSNTPPPATQVKAGEAAAAAAQVPLVNPNPMPDTAKQSDSYARAYALGKEVSVTREAPGTVRRLSVAVVLREPEGKPRTAQELQQLTNLVRTAVGYDASRNDQVTVISRKFASKTEAGEDGGPSWYDASWVPMLARHLTALAIALLVLFLGIRPLVTALLKRRNDRGIAGFLGDGPASAAGFREPVSVDMLDSARGYDDKVALVRDFTRDNPARAALAVRDMIRSDDKGGR